MPTCIVSHSDALDGSVDAHSSTHTYITVLRKLAQTSINKLYVTVLCVLERSLSWLQTKLIHGLSQEPNEIQ